MNQLLPVILPGVITLLVLAVFLGFFYAWVKDPEVRKIVRRVSIVLVACTLLAVAVFAISTYAVQPQDTLDREARQERQQNDLQRRLDAGGH